SRAQAPARASRAPSPRARARKGRTRRAGTARALIWGALPRTAPARGAPASGPTGPTGPTRKAPARKRRRTTQEGLPVQARESEIVMNRTMDVRTEMRKLADSKPVHAAAGAGVLASETLRELTAWLTRWRDEASVNTLST